MRTSCGSCLNEAERLGGGLEEDAEGATEADLLDAYPRLTREDVHAALRYAADSVAHEVIVLTPEG